jgi:hypothetical protein
VDPNIVDDMHRTPLLDAASNMRKKSTPASRRILTALLACPRLMNKKEKIIAVMNAIKEAEEVQSGWGYNEVMHMLEGEAVID